MQVKKFEYVAGGGASHMTSRPYQILTAPTDVRLEKIRANGLNDSHPVRSPSTGKILY